jgi:hypothetical protein
LLLCCGWWQARAGLHGAAFVYEQNKSGEAIFHPVLAPSIGVQLEKGPREINKGEVLVCKSGTEEHKAFVEGQETTITTFTLTCGQRVFALKSVYFEEQ